MTQSVQNRHPAGTSVGGQYAPGSATEIEDSLDTGAGFGGMSEDEVVAHISKCVESTYSRYGWSRNQIIKGWDINDVKNEVALALYSAKARGSLEKVRSPKAFISQTARNTISGNLIYDKMRSYDRKLSSMAAERVNQIEASTGRVLSSAERDQVLRRTWEDWDPSKYGPKPGEGSLRLISQVNNRMHMDSIETGGHEGGMMEVGDEANMYGQRDLAVEEQALNQAGSISSDDIDYYEKAAKAAKSDAQAKASLRATAISSLAEAHGAPDVKPGSVAPASARRHNETIRSLGGAAILAREYEDGDTSNAETLLAPWGGTRQVSTAQAQSIVQMLTRSGQYGDDVWSTAMKAASDG